MNPVIGFPAIDRRALLSLLAMFPLLSASLRSTTAEAQAQRSASVLERRRDQIVDPRLRSARHDARRA
jgi:hypothetical protein